MTEYGRKWADHHVAAGYHLQDWGPPPTKDCPLIGTYQGAAGKITVRHLTLGPSGVGVAELEIEWEDGAKVTVLNEATALQYLLEYGAAERV